MIEARLEAVRAVRQEADRLRMACIAAAGGAALLHIAYDQELDARTPIEETVLLGRLGNIPR